MPARRASSRGVSLCAAGVELVYRGQVTYGEGIRAFSGGAQCLEDPQGEVAAAVVFAYGAVIGVGAHTLFTFLEVTPFTLAAPG